MSENKKYKSGTLYSIDVSLINADPDQPRKYFDETALAELTNSIQQHGIIQPLVLRQSEDGKLYIIAGERRLQAAIKCGMKEVPCIFNEGKPSEIALIENILRKDLTAVEEAEAMQNIITHFNYSQDDLAKMLGKGRSTIVEVLGINKLPDAIKDACRKDHRYSKSVLIEVAKLKTEKQMLKQFAKFEKSGISRNEVRGVKRRGKENREKIEVAIDAVKDFGSRLDKMQETWTKDEMLKIKAELEGLKGRIEGVLKGM